MGQGDVLVFQLLQVAHHVCFAVVAVKNRMGQEWRLALKARGYDRLYLPGFDLLVDLRYRK